MIIKFTDIEENVKPQKEYKEGRYVVRITKAVEEAPVGKTPYLEVTFETTEDNIFSVKKRFYQSPKALSILLNLLSACGLYDSNSKDDLELNPDDLVGCTLDVEFKKGEETSDGKRYLEFVAWSAKAVNSTTTKKSVVQKSEPKVEVVEEETDVPF